MRKFKIFIIFIFLSSNQLMSQEISFSFDSLLSKFTNSITLRKIESVNKKLTIVCSFSNKDLSFVEFNKKYNFYIRSENKIYPSSSVSITPLNNSIELLTIVFPNYIDTVDQVDLFSDCETCLYFKGISLIRSYDVLILKDGSVIQVVLIEESENNIKYKKIGAVNDSVFSILRNQVSGIRYQLYKGKTANKPDSNAKMPVQIIPDIIVLMNKRAINANVLEVGIDEVKYKKSDYMDGPTFSVWKKDIYFIKYKNGQTDTLNSYSKDQAMQYNLVNQATKDMDTLNYGGYFSVGFALGGGGLVGIPLRIYPSELVAVDVTLGLRPMIGTSNSSSEIGINEFLTAGFDFYFNKKYNPTKERVQMSGIFIKGGVSSGKRYDEVFGAVGWAYEHYKNIKRSFTFELGIGMLKMNDKDFSPATNPLKPAMGEAEYSDKFMIFWKLGWNFF